MGASRGGQATEGIAPLRAGLAAYRATGAATYVPFYLTLLADAEGKANELDQGLGHLAEAEGLVAESEERWTEAELHRGPRGIAAQRRRPQRCGAMLSPSHRHCATAKCEILGAARRHQSCPALARAG